MLGAREIDDAWLTFFGVMEYGSVLGVADFCARCTVSAPSELLCPDFSVVPTLTEIEAAFRAVPAMKAHGLDNLPAELFKSMPGALAKLYCPLYTKAALACQQPAQWKGGILFDMHKGRGSAADVASFTSLLISSLPAKAMHRILRSRLRGIMDDTLHELHCGIAKCRPVSLPTHVLRLALRKHKAAKQSCAVLFLDTATAYYAVVRDFALGDITSDKDIVAIFCRFGLQDADVCESIWYTSSRTFIPKLGLSAVSVRATKSAPQS